MKKKKVLAVLTAAALTGSMAAGCGSSAATSTSSASGTAATSTEGADTEAPAAHAEVPEIVALPEVELLSVDAKASIANLKTDGMVNPLGLDDETPSFSWQMQSDVTGAAQKAYQIIVKDSEGNTIWDSGVVESQDSVDILYEGEALQASSQYVWTVAVTDTADKTVTSEEATFETGLMDETFASFDGAKWIGSDELPISAFSLPQFRIQANVQIAKGSNAVSFILGADDYRLEDANFNTGSVANEENYVRVELDVTDGSNPKFNVYRKGFTEDGSEELVATVEDSDKLKSVITEANKNDVHELQIGVTASTITFVVDGTSLTDKITVNSLGSSILNSYPNLNSVGFAANKGEAATITDYSISNNGDYSKSTLLDANLGGGYGLFQELDGLKVEDNTISVEGGEEGILVYADPTYQAAPMLRKEFTAASEVAKARLYVTAQGIYDIYMNGQEIAPEEWFNPGNEQYDQILSYNTYDVTSMLQDGDNAIGAVLGEGYWAGQMSFDTKNANYYGDQPALMAKLVLTYADGSEETIVSDESWQLYKDGPVRLASMLQGETYDATKEVEGWAETGLDAAAWSAAAEVATREPFANPKLFTRTDTPVHVIRTNDATLVGETREGSGAYIYDMGENVAGVPVITIPAEYAEAGKTITIRVAEILYPEIEEYKADDLDGKMMVENYRTALATDFYTMKDGEQVFAPDLTQHGYRYIEITGFDEALPAENVKMQVLSSLDPNGTYESSNEMANQLYTNIVNSEASNYISLPTDCPQRDERLGWTGDAQLFALTGSYLADTYNFMDVWMDTVRATSKDGISAQYAPDLRPYAAEDTEIEHPGMSFGITWNAVAVTVPYNLYMQTGRTDIIENNIENINTYIDNLASKPLEYKDADGNKQTEARLSDEIGDLADHLSRVKTNGPLLSSAVYIECLDDAAVMNDAIGNSDKAAEYRQLAADARAAWNELFIDLETGKTRDAAGEIQDTQASYATPLRYNVVSEENLPKVLENYNATIAEASGEDTDGVAVTPYTLTTGFNATGNLLPSLSMNGLNDTAYQLFESEEYASWLYPVTEGATSVWERWNAVTGETGFNGNNSMNSFNHYSYGAVGDWMIGYQAGITSNPTDPGYQSFILQPTTGGAFTDLSASYESSYGTIASAWTAADGQMKTYDVTVPANTTATLYLPSTAEDAASLEGVTCVGQEVHNGIDVTVYQLVAGTYHFDIADSITVK